MIWMEWEPVFENAWAMARPMPREPPVIRTRVGRCCVGVEVKEYLQLEVRWLSLWPLRENSENSEPG